MSSTTIMPLWRNSEDAAFTLAALALGPMENLVHVLIDRASGNAAVVDPAWEPEAILQFVGQEGAQLTDIYLTHTHGDHVNAVAPLLEAIPGLRVHVHPLERWPARPAAALDWQIGPNQLGETSFEVLFTPGHTAGGVCLLLPDHVISGDTLFVFGCGRCDLPGGDPRQMFASLQQLKARLTPETMIHCGHTYSVQPVSTWAEELVSNPFLHFAEEDDFVRYRMEVHDQVRNSPYGPVSVAAAQAQLAG
jgi:hydroxyacylglutathione hydrolase